MKNLNKIFCLIFFITLILSYKQASSQDVFGRARNTEMFDANVILVSPDYQNAGTHFNSIQQAINYAVATFGELGVKKIKVLPGIYTEKVTISSIQNLEIEFDRGVLLQYTTTGSEHEGVLNFIYQDSYITNKPLLITGEADVRQLGTNQYGHCVYIENCDYDFWTDGPETPFPSFHFNRLSSKGGSVIYLPSDYSNYNNIGRLYLSVTDVIAYLGAVSNIYTISIGSDYPTSGFELILDCPFVMSLTGGCLNVGQYAGILATNTMFVNFAGNKPVINVTSDPHLDETGRFATGIFFRNCLIQNLDSSSGAHGVSVGRTDCVFIEGGVIQTRHASSKSIFYATPVSCNIYGTTMANFAKHDSVTVATGTLSVSSSVRIPKKVFVYPQ